MSYDNKLLEVVTKTERNEQHMSYDNKLREVVTKTEPKQISSRHAPGIKLYTISEKRKIVEESRVDGVHLTARKYNLHSQTIYTWNRQDLTIDRSTFPELEQQIVAWVQDQNQPLSYRAVRKYSIGLIKPHYPHFNASKKWLKKINYRNSLELIFKQYTISEKQKIVEESRNEGIKHTARKYKLHRATIYKWLAQTIAQEDITSELKEECVV